MYIFKNAWISIKRNKGRNILIGIILFIIACATSIALAIQNTANNLISSYESSYNKEATISFNRGNMMKNFDMTNKDGMEDAKEKFSNITSNTYTLEDVKNYADSKYVESYSYTIQINLNGDSIEKVSSDFSYGENNGKRNNQINTKDFTIIGYSKIDKMNEFIDGTYTMVEITDDAWDKILDSNYVFINEELATLNNLSLNSNIILIDENDISYQFTVVGIYKELETTDTPSMFSTSSNTILTGSKYLEELINTYNLDSTVNPTFILKSYSDTENFQNELYEKGLNENYVVETNEELALSAVKEVSNVSSFAKTFLIVTLTIGAVVLFIINMINIRERKYEIGVLRTIGVSKLKVTMQFVFELLVIALISLILGSGVGALSSKSVGNYLLANEIKSSTEETNEIESNMKMPDNQFNQNINGVVNVTTYDNINAVVDFTVLIELLGISLVLVFISSIAAMISIERFSPLTILKERS